MPKIKVSVVIPVFSADKYITKCIESLLSQTLRECEFIFVNDGSIDQSRNIIERFQKIDSRIILINQENQGVSKARNNGLLVAKGCYIGFVDADDYIEKDFYERLYNTAFKDDCDIVLSNLESVIDGHKVTTKYPFPVDVNLEKEFINHRILYYFIENNDLNSVCNKIYKRSLIKDNNKLFPQGVYWGEDGLFNLHAFSHATSIKYIDYTGYHYNEVVGSATRNALDQNYFGKALEDFHTSLPENILKHLSKEKIQKLKARKLIKNVMSFIHIYSTPANKIGFRRRYRYIKGMIGHYSVKRALEEVYLDSKNINVSRYEKVLIQLIKKQSTLGLFFITAYSRFRNKSFGGVL